MLYCEKSENFVDTAGKPQNIYKSPLKKYTCKRILKKFHNCPRLKKEIKKGYERNIYNYIYIYTHINKIQ